MLSEKDIRNSTAKIEKTVSELKDANQRFEDFLRKEKTAEGRILSSFNAILLKEAKRILSESSPSEIKNYLGKAETDPTLAANLLCGEGIVSYELVRNELDPLFEDLKKYQKGKRLIEKVYTPANRKIVEDTIAKANEACVSSLQWFFKTQKERKDIVEAANLLFRLKETNYISTSYRLDESEENDALDESWKIDELNHITKGRVFEENEPEKPSFDQLNEKIKELIQCGAASMAAEKAYSQLKKKLQGNAALLKKSEVDAMLAKVEVDELNRNKEGIRISALKDAGLKNVLDVLKESTYKLSSLNGISEEMASKIKTNATAIADNMTAAATLKLNREKRDTLSDEVVKLLHSYITEKKNIELSDEVSGVLNRVYGTLTDRTIAKNAIEWFTSSFDNRSRTLSTVKEMSDLSADDLSTKAKKIAENYKNAEISEEEAWDFFERNTAECYSTLEKLVPGLFKGSDTYYGLPENLAREVADETIFPNGLLCTLRRYQEWGVKYILHQKKVLLGDEMGLGKTVQAIATMVSLKNTGASHFLVVCPASVVINWCREVEKHSLLKVIKIHGSNRELCLKEWIEKGGVGVTTFETTSRIALPENFNYSLLVVDEAHYIKNPSAKRTQNVLSIAKKAERELFMTGTALENNIDEMIELVGDLKPELVSEIKRMRYMATADSFREKIASVYYRRKREDVLGELPDLIEAEEWCSLMEEEKKLYHKAVLSAKQSEVRRVSWNVDNLELSCKANRLKEIVEEAERDGRKVIVFSFFLDTIAKIKDYLGDRCLMPITGALNPSKRQELIDEFEKDPTKSVLIAQIQAGGTGLNIQSASVVVITEPQWKPSTENQAISRAYRMGQSRSVLVYRLLCEKTADEKVIKRLKEKQEIFDAFADKAEAVKEVEIDESAYSDIIKEEIERIKKEQDEE